GVKRLHLHGGVIHLGQRRDRQLPEGRDADQHHPGHHQRGRHRPQDEDSRGTHCGAPPPWPFLPPPFLPPPFLPRPPRPPAPGSKPGGLSSSPAFRTRTVAPSISLSVP